MFKLSTLAAIAAAAVMGLMCAAPAQAQATRTWVSGVGDDANPCSRTAPCKTLAGAISKTAAGGEIDCLDPGGVGALTITKSITIDGLNLCGILSASTNGINVNAAVTDRIKIRRLTIDGVNTGLNGINFLAGGALIVEHVAIWEVGAGAGNAGIKFIPSGAARLEMHDVEIQYGVGTSDGILIKPTGTGTAIATLRNVTSIFNGGSGLRVDSTGQSSGNGPAAYIKDCNFSHDGTGVNAAGGTIAALAEVFDSIISANTGAGVVGGGGTGLVILGKNAVVGNPTGLGGNVKSFGDNYVVNPTNGAPTLPNLTPL